MCCGTELAFCGLLPSLLPKWFIIIDFQRQRPIKFQIVCGEKGDLSYLLCSIAMHLMCIMSLIQLGSLIVINLCPSLNPGGKHLHKYVCVPMYG